MTETLNIVKNKPIGVWSTTKHLSENITLLKKFPADFFCYCITRKNDLQKLETLLTSINSTIQVYIILFPPSENTPSPPYHLDFNKWVKHVNNIHSAFSNLNGIVIDDFNCASFKHGNNFTVWEQPKILKQLLNMKNALGNLKFHLVIYEHSILDRNNMFNQFIDFITTTNMLFDDLIVPWKNLWTTIGLRKSILHVRNSFPNKKVIGLVYGCKTSWYPFRPFLKTYQNIANLTYKLSDSLIFYGFHSTQYIYQKTTQLIENWKGIRKTKRV